MDLIKIGEVVILNKAGTESPAMVMRGQAYENDNVNLSVFGEYGLWQVTHVPVVKDHQAGLSIHGAFNMHCYRRP